ncbi:TM0026 family membrane protein [Pseudothermotoga sp.]|nr:alkaline shock response membrane anchor protein AmaP [Pseudothermotoga sp.]MDW8139926.1 hypothetical protein [Pseudothermotoga sp.]
MSTRALLGLFAWALVLELFVLIYYLQRGIRPFEFYLNVVLLILTALFLIILIFREKRRRGRDDEPE